TLLENWRLKLPEAVVPPKLIWQTPLVKNAMLLKVRKILSPLHVVALVRLRLSAKNVLAGPLVIVCVLLLLAVGQTMKTCEPLAGKPPFQLAESLRFTVSVLLNVPRFQVTEPASTSAAKRRGTRTAPNVTTSFPMCPRALISLRPCVVAADR